MIVKIVVSILFKHDTIPSLLNYYSRWCCNIITAHAILSHFHLYTVDLATCSLMRSVKAVTMTDFPFQYEEPNTNRWTTNWLLRNRQSHYGIRHWRKNGTDHQWGVQVGCTGGEMSNLQYWGMLQAKTFTQIYKANHRFYELKFFEGALTLLKLQ